MNSRYLTLNGKPWLPVMGEFHFSRVPESQWNADILKMKAAGVEIVSTYIFWIHHEEIEGQFDWTGRRDLRHFVKLCAEDGMYVWLRIGPWDHGEARNGGFPDWLLKKVPPQDLRRDDPLFMSYVRKLYAQIGGQVQGLMWNQGGPVIGVQLENEYSTRGPHAGVEYILALKNLAIASGLRAPIYSVTGWDHAAVPQGATVAVWGGYPDAPWDRTLHQLPAQEVYEFRFGNRASGKMGANAASPAENPSNPFMTAEMGGGNEDTYHRRPVIQPDDVAAMMPVLLGSGVNLYGTYMFQGGINPNGKLTTLQESQATGYPNDLPIKSYDFQAPLSAFGQERSSLRKLKVFNYFLNDFGSLLAPMPSFAPDRVPSGPSDFSMARVAVRTNGTGGFLFFNNYVRYNSMPGRPHFQVSVDLPGGTLKIPEEPVNLPSGEYGIWPFGLTLGGLHLRYATAELFCRLADGSNLTYYFVATRDVPAQFVLEPGHGVEIETSGVQSPADGAVFVSHVEPSLAPVITAHGPGGVITRIVLLTQQQAEDAWKLNTGSQHLLLTHAQLFASGSSVTLQQNGDPVFNFTVTPPVAATPVATPSPQAVSADATAGTFRFALPGAHPRIEVRKIRAAGPVPPVSLGPSSPGKQNSVAMAPKDQEFAQVAAWKISIPESDWKGVENLFLVLHYDGDIAHLSSGGNLLDDNFYNGKPWSVGLNRFAPQIARSGLELQILPRRADAPIFLERHYRDHPANVAQIMQLKSLQLIPQYQLQLRFAPH
jgi:beta-galactosidase